MLKDVNKKSSGDFKVNPKDTRPPKKIGGEPPKKAGGDKKGDDKNGLKGSGYKVWNPEELTKEPADSFRVKAVIPAGSEDDWPGGPTRTLINRLPEYSKKCLGIKGDNTMS